MGETYPCLAPQKQNWRDSGNARFFPLQVMRGRIKCEDLNKMKRNEIYNELVKIRKLVDPKIDNLIYGKLSRLIDAVNDDRHTNYDQFECVEDIVSRFDQLRKQMHVIEKDITWIKLGDFSKRGEND